MTRVFISRSLDSDSPLLELSDKCEIIGQSLIKFTPVSFSFNFDGKWLFFYSSNGIRYFYNGLNDNQRKAIQNYKIGVMGQGSSEVFYELFGKLPELIHNGILEETVETLTKNEESILFIKAQNSLSTVEKYIDPLLTEELFVYNNEPNHEVIIPDADIYIMTSPMNAEIYMKRACCRFNTKIIAIGETTNKKLMEYGFLLASIADQPNEENILKLLKTMV